MERRKDSKGRVLEKGENQRKDGTYMYRYTDEWGKRHCVYRRTLNELREVEKRIRRDLEDCLNIQLENRTLNEQFVEYYRLSTHLAFSTRQNYKNLWQRYIQNSVLGQKKIPYIKKSDGKRFVADMISNGLKSRTIKGIYGLMRNALESAVEDGIIRSNPFKGELNLSKDDEAEKIPITVDQQKQLFDFMNQSTSYRKYVPIYTVLLETGIRCGELCGLTWKDVDLKNRVLRIDHQLHFMEIDGKAQFYASSPKTKTSIRTIPLTQNAVEAFHKQRVFQFESGRRNTEPCCGYSDFVFTTEKGTPFGNTAINEKLRNTIKAMNKATPGCNFPLISPHTLRHTCCTRMVEAHMDLKAIQAILGHANVATTLNVYTHISNEKVASELEKFEANSTKIG